MIDAIVRAWRRFEIMVRNTVAHQGLVQFREAALRDGFDYSEISDEHLFFAIGTAAVAYYNETKNVAPLVVAVQMKVGLPAGDLLCRAVSVAESVQLGKRPFVG